MNKPLCHGLYAITDPLLLAPERFLDAVEQSLLGGARVIQYRDKSNDSARRLAQARELNQLCQRYQVPLLINDDVELAMLAGAAGVHLGREDMLLHEARAQLGAHALIGVSCYNQLDIALAAEQAGVDYVAFGAVFPSPTKPGEVRASMSLLREAHAALRIPIVAIGGITPDNAPLLLDVGVDALAVVSGIFAQPDIRAAAARYAELFIPTRA